LRTGISSLNYDVSVVVKPRHGWRFSSFTVEWIFYFTVNRQEIQATLTALTAICVHAWCFILPWMYVALYTYSHV